jgi:LPS export ABC transporter protein LptC
MSETGASILRQNRSAEATHRAVRRWRRRSLVILFWRGALPTLIVVGLLGLGAWAGIRTFAQLTPTGRTGGDIRMVNPEFHGRDKKAMPYVVTADAAVRDPQRMEHVALTEPRMVMQTLAHGDLHVSAHTGQYDEQTKILVMNGDVVVDTGKDEHFRSPSARVDTQADTAEGHEGVEAFSPLGRSTASAYSLDDKAGYAHLTGNVHTHLNPHGQQDATASPQPNSQGPKGKP